MTFITRLRDEARDRPRRVVFPEGSDPRTVSAVRFCAREQLLSPVVLGGPEVKSALHSEGDGVDIEVVDPRNDPGAEVLARSLYERRKGRGMTAEDALQHAQDPLLFGALLVATGQADGAVAGAANPTSAVLRAALWGIGPAPGIRTVSSSFFMVVEPFRGTSDAEVLIFTDAGVVPDPDSTQLAEIAMAACEARRSVVGDEPRVAFLSYSTLGSAVGPATEKMIDALRIFRARAPGIPADGELQVDAALISEVAAVKAPGSPVAGTANILVFPDLAAANIGYKLVERLARARAIGPIVQGLARPYNDLSRGATSDDIVNVACITSLMSQ
ncbi:MAG TPA: phosphate acetyltransferase [Longimicrobiaceae bacterium]|nr:phosphate acetyltransferase [Longimicrobiaceae bacterium]